MTNRDIYPCYIKIVDDAESDDIMELPTEENGTILLSTIQAQYPNCTGLRYKTENGSWRGIRLSDNVLDPPEEGWGEREFFITLAKDTIKRKMDSFRGQEPEAKIVRKTTEDDLLSDLIVLGLTYSATEDDLKTYFEKFGELEMYEIKCDPTSGKSKGFGFIRYKSVEAARKALKLNHVVGGRRCEVRLPKKQEEMPTKLFIGRLKEGTTTDNLREHFSAYGELKDVYIPKNFRGFGFVTFDSQEVARTVMDTSHIIEGSCVNVTFAEPKGGKSSNLPVDYNTQATNYGNYPGYNNYTSGYTTQAYDSTTTYDPQQTYWNNT